MAKGGADFSWTILLRDTGLPKVHFRPDVLKAVAPNLLWSRGLGYLQSWVRGQHFYVYMIIDICSRKIIAAEVFTSETGEYAAELLQRALLE